MVIRWVRRPCVTCGPVFPFCNFQNYHGNLGFLSWNTIVVIFFRGCVSEMVVLSYSVIYYIYIPGTLGPCFHYWCSVYGICKWSDTLVMFVCLQITTSHHHHYADLSEGIELLKCLVSYMLPSVCLRLRQFSQLSFVRYMGLCVFSLPNSPAMIMRMCTLSYYHHQIGSMNH